MKQAARKLKTAAAAADAAAPDMATARIATLKQALEAHTAGRLDEASALYGELHAAAPRDSEVLFLMGVLCCDLGLFEQACRFLEQALDFTPAFPEALAQWAVALQGLAELAIGAGKLTEARRHLERSLTVAPGDPAALQGLGRVAIAVGDFAAAESHLTESLAQRPMHVQTLNWLGLARLQQGKHAAAENSLRQALYLQPDLNQARNNLGLALHHQERFAEARCSFEAALALDPSYAQGRVNLGVTLRALGDLAAARRELEAVLVARPDEIDALNNLGVVCQDLGLAREAYRHLSHALELAPESAPARWNLSLTQLLLGDFANGWRNYEARWEGCSHLQGGYRFPAERAWRGEPLTGRRVLLWAEQGFGDTIQFIRFARDLAERGATVEVLAPAALVPLLHSAPGVSVVQSQDQVPPYDLHCPLLSLPLRLGVTVDAARLHGAAPYLTAPSVVSEHWRQRLSDHPGLKVGLVWAGNARTQSLELKSIDLRRSVAIGRLGPLLAVAGCSFFSLQKDAAALELADPALRARAPFDTVTVHDYSAEWLDFSDTAAFIANLDLVISVDTAVAHLAGALGRPVWLLNRFDSCWRWLEDRDDSPWYATLRQFRQTRSGDWGPVIGRAAAALEELVAATPSGGVSFSGIGQSTLDV